MITIHPNDVPLGRAIAAHAGSSFVPERRGAQRQAEYVEHMTAVARVLDQYRTPENSDDMDSQLERYRQGYLARFLRQLDAASRTMSTMITGPSNFPTARNAKRLETERRRAGDLQQFHERAMRALLRRFGPRYIISSDDADALDAIRKKIAEREAFQELAKAGNKIVRSKKLSEEEKRAQLRDLGFGSALVQESLHPRESYLKPGIPSWSLSNNNAQIRRLRERLATLERQRADTTRKIDFPGGCLVDSVEDNRVQLVFDEKPAEGVRQALRARGFVWARSSGAWQRKRGTNALHAAAGIVGVEL